MTLKNDVQHHRSEEKKHLSDYKNEEAKLTIIAVQKESVFNNFIVDGLNDHPIF